MQESITFRPETDADAAYIEMLYASTRVDEMAMVPWPDEQKTQFVRMQGKAQKDHYVKHYPDCQYLVIERDGVPIGRLYIDRGHGDIFIIDITLDPSVRGAGLGTVILRDLMDESTRTGRKVTIHVENFNPALRLYQRLGFRQISTYGVYYLMEWTATPAESAAT